MRLGLYTTVFPGVEPFLADWWRSVRAQSDQDFALWIGLDGLDAARAVAAIGEDPCAQWVAGRPGASPAEIRQQTWQQMLPHCDAVIMVDSDDLLAPTRVAAARAMLAACDLGGCGLRLVDGGGRPLGPVAGVASGAEAASLLPRQNILGLSNTAYRADLLRRCLPLPADLAVVDWYLATRAWLLGARLDFDPTPHMDYRQHGANMTQIQGPFSASRVARDTAHALRHFQALATASGPEHASPRHVELARAAADTRRFNKRIVADPDNLARYVAGLNAFELPLVWWIGVAHPALAHMWQP